MRNTVTSSKPTALVLSVVGVLLASLPRCRRARAATCAAPGAERSVDGQDLVTRPACGSGRPADDAGREDLAAARAGRVPGRGRHLERRRGRHPGRAATRVAPHPAGRFRRRRARGGRTRPLRHAAAVDDGRGRHVGPGTRLRVRRGDRPRASRPAVPVVAGRRREPDARAAQRTELRVPRRRPDPRRQDGRPGCSRACRARRSSGTSSTTPSTTRRPGGTSAT